jgi:geranylgeranyl pyrophosphate synthase
LVTLLRLGGKKSPEHTDEIVRMLNRYRSVEYARSVAVGLIADGRRYLEVVRPSRARTVLGSMADYMLERQR